jgi:dolichol-phosphate mannosyltransferase
MNEALCLPRLHAELARHCDPLPYQFEFIFVDDGSTDQTAAVLEELRRRDPRVRYLILSRNFGHQAALSAGLRHARGDAVIMMDSDLQHPPSLIPQLLERWRAGFDVVNTVRRQTQGINPLKRLWSWGFYRAFNWLTGMKVSAGSSDFRLMARDAVEVLNNLPERTRFLRGLVPWLGFRQDHIEFDAPARWAGEPKYTFWRSLRFALEGITSFSFYPLRRAAVAGWLVIMASVVYGLYVLGAHLFGSGTVPGWTSLLLCVLFLGGVQLMLIGVLGEYVGRVLEQVKGRPMYIVREATGFSAPARQDEEAARLRDAV